MLRYYCCYIFRNMCLHLNILEWFRFSLFVCLLYVNVFVFVVFLFYWLWIGPLLMSLACQRMKNSIIILLFIIIIIIHVLGCNQSYNYFSWDPPPNAVLLRCVGCVGYQGWVRRIYDKVLVWAPRDISLMIMSYQVLHFLWCVVVAQLAGRIVDSITRRVWIDSKSGAEDYSNCNWIKHDFSWWALIYLFAIPN
jgi:hypothetical protein